MTGRREFVCRPCRDDRCEECVRLTWSGEGCVHACLAGRQPALFTVGELLDAAAERPAPEGPAGNDIDW